MLKYSEPRFLVSCLLSLFLISCSPGSSSYPELPKNPNDNTAQETPPKDSSDVTEPTPTNPAPDEPNTSNPPSEPEAPPVVTLPPLPTGDLAKENIGTKVRVSGLFDRWTLKSTVTGYRGKAYAELTTECRGKIEINLALTTEQWKDNVQKAKYYSEVNKLIEKNGMQLLAENGNPLQGEELQMFIRALKALSWQESNWQHYFRYKNWFFVILSGGSYNALDDWGISQVARSGFKASQLYNVEFFNKKDYCSLSKSLYYGFTEFLQNYMEARSLSCNRTGNEFDKILGAYNRYSSGYSACYNGLSSDSDYRKYQIGAMNGIKGYYNSTPWLSAMEP